MTARITAGVVVALALVARARGAGLATPPDYGFNFATVTHAGNAPTQTFPRPGFPTHTVGGVDHVYRIATTEVTNGQWLDFVRAYAPFVASNAVGSPTFKGTGIIFTGFSGGVPQYVMPSSLANRPVEIGWRYATRFTNWLHNGRKGVGEAVAADFENGAYDTSTFAVNPDGTINDQATRHAGAQYWIPSFDEWVKAAYWDPNRFGPDQGGYWTYPITSDTAPVTGDPASGGQTNMGVTFPPGQTRPLDVGSYPDMRSPWGRSIVRAECVSGVRTGIRSDSGVSSARACTTHLIRRWGIGLSTQ